MISNVMRIPVQLPAHRACFALQAIQQTPNLSLYRVKPDLLCCVKRHVDKGQLVAVTACTFSSPQEGYSLHLTEALLLIA